MDVATHKEVQNHPDGRKLTEQKKQLRNELEARKKHLYDEFIVQQQQLDDQFAAECKIPPVNHTQDVKMTARSRSNSRGYELALVTDGATPQALADLIIGKSIDRELCRIGGLIANSHKDISPLMLEHRRIGQELNSHDKKGMV